jgi:FtsH-binding integral membrane protein
MSVAVAQPAKIVTNVPGRRYDHRFFSTTAALMLLTVIIGFGPTYYFAGAWRAPLPSPMIHLHGALFSSWMLLLIVQTSLVSAKRVDIHRRLGIVGFIIALAMIVVGPLAATDSLVRGRLVVGPDVQAFYLIPLTDILIFGVVIAAAFRARRDSAAHKRYIYIATTSLLIAAVARWHVPFIFHNPFLAGLASDIFLVILVGYDLWSTRRIHRATLWASIYMLIIQQIRYPIAASAPWHSFAAWVQSIAS